MFGGVGTNNLVELLSLWSFLKFAIIFRVTKLKVYGDSKLINDWITCKAYVNNLILLQWGQRTLGCKNSFDRITFQHIYREINHIADMYTMSKLGTTS